MKKGVFLCAAGLVILLISISFVSAAWTATGECNFGDFFRRSGSETFSDEAACGAYVARGNGICHEKASAAGYGFVVTSFRLIKGCTEDISPAERQRKEKEMQEELRKQSEERIKEFEKKSEEDTARIIREEEEKSKERSETFKKELERQEIAKQEKAADTFEPLFGRRSGKGISKHGYPRGSYLAEDPGEYNIRFTDGKVNLINIGSGQQAVFEGIGVHIGQEISFLPPINPSGLSKKSISGTGKQPGTTPGYNAKLKGAEDSIEVKVKNMKDPKTGEDLVGFEIKVKENAQAKLIEAKVEIEEDGQKIGEFPLKVEIEEEGENEFYLYSLSNYTVIEELKRCYRKPDGSCCANPAVFERMSDACFDAQNEESGAMPAGCADFFLNTPEEEQLSHPENVPEKCKKFAAKELTDEETAKALESGEIFYDENGKKLGSFKITLLKTYLRILNLFN